jgi:hypothetical protein
MKRTIFRLAILVSATLLTMAITLPLSVLTLPLTVLTIGSVLAAGATA